MKTKLGTAMGKVTFSFLLVHGQGEKFQDTVTYEVEDNRNFEDVISHICSVFNFDRDKVTLKSNLGFKIEDLSIDVEEFHDFYGAYYKILVDEPHKENHDDSDDEWRDVSHLNDSQNFEKPSDSDIFHDIIEDLTLIGSENWEEDEFGRAEITIVPYIDTYITNIRVIYDLSKSVTSFIQDISKTCNVSPEEIILTSLDEKIPIIPIEERSMRSLLEEYGAVFVLYPEILRNEIESRSETISVQMKELLFKYKRNR